jgi:peptidoglycan/LPS O-acetylase OafA/YrhL
MSAGPGYRSRYESLDVWRGVACLMVVVHHTGFFSLHWSETMGSSVEAWVRWGLMSVLLWMDLGVPLFFVISGYCIAASLDSHVRRGASAWVFLGRRFRRIYPPYWASVALFAGVIWSLDHFGLTWLHRGAHSLELDSPGKLDWMQWLGNFTLTEEWRPRAFGGSSREVFTRVAWSLCYEEQFYFVGFLAMLVAPRRLHGMLGGLTVAIVGLRVFAYDSGGLWRYEGTFVSRWHEFAVGLLVYWRLVAARSKIAKHAFDACLIALCAIGMVHNYRTTWVAAGFGLGLIAFRRFDESWSRLNVLEPLRACGRRSYSIYLVHLLVCTIGNELLFSLGIVNFWAKVLVTTPIVGLTAVGAGWAFFAIVESRFLNPPADRKPHAHPVAGETPESGQCSVVSGQ